MKFLKIFLITIIFINNLISLVFANDISTQNTTNSQENKPIPNRPILNVSSNNTYNIESGKSTNITIPIVNSSSDIALDVFIKAKVGGENSPLTVKFLNSSDRVNNILRGGSHNISLSIDVDNNAKSGKYPITLEYSFTSLDNQNFSSSDTFYIKVDTGVTIPTIALNNLKVSKDNVIVGDSFDVTAVLENLSTGSANSVNVEIIGLEENNISVVGGISNAFFPKFSGNEKQNISFKLATTKLTKEGSNKITLKVTYKDDEGKEYTKDYFTYITSSKTKEDNSNKVVDLKISSLVAPTNTFNVGQSGTFKLKIKNNSNEEVKNIKVSTKLPENIVPTSNSIIFIDKLAGNQERELTFSVSPTANAITQTYSIGFLVEHIDNSKNTDKNENTTSNTTILEQYAGFNVNNPNAKKQQEGEKPKVSVPKIIVSRYEAVPTIVEAGKSFKLSMTFKNTHQTKTVKNIKIFLTVDDKTEEKGNVFAPDNSSTTYFIDSIAPKKEIEHTFSLFAVPDAKPRSYTINVNFEYEDEEANEFKSVELVGVNVKQQANLELSDITKQENGNVGEPMNVNFQLYNTGKVTLSNLLIKLEGEDFDTSTATNFIGNFSPGSTEYYDATFTPKSAGEKNLKLIITYNDTDGKEIEKIQEFKVNINENIIPEEDDFSEQPPAEPEKNFPTKIIGIICGVVFVIGFGIFAFVKKSKAKKELDFIE